MILKICLQILMLSWCLSLAWAQPQPSGTVRLNDGGRTITKAVLVGISDYQHINDLKYADDDAIALAAYLAEHPDVEEDEVVLLLNEQASKNNVQRAIYTTLSQAKKGEQVIIYFAGHGDANNTESLVDAGYLLCYGVSKYALYEIDEAINIANIQNWVDAAAEKGVYVVLMIDACRAGRFVDNNSQATVAKALSGLAQGFQKSIKLISCQPNQLSYEDAKWGGGHGVFTHYLLQGLQGASIDTAQTKSIEVYDLFKYIEEQTVADTERKQIPLRGGNSTHKLFRFYKSQNNLIDTDSLRVTPLPRNNLSKKSAIDLSKEKVSKALGKISNGSYKNLSNNAWKQAIKAASKLAKKADSEEEQVQYAFYKNIIEGYSAIALNKIDEIDQMESMAETLYASNKRSANLFNLLGELAQAKNQQEKAIYYFNESRLLAGNWLQPHANIVDSYLAKEDFKIAYRMAYDNFERFRLSEKGIMQLDIAFELAENFIQENEREDLSLGVVLATTELDEQLEAEKQVLKLLNNFEEKYQWQEITLAATSYNIEAMGEAFFLASQSDFTDTETLKDLQILLGQKFGYFVDTSTVFKKDILLEKISYKSAGYGSVTQNIPKFLYLRGHIYEDKSGEKYLVASKSAPKTAGFVAKDYLNVTEILGTIDRNPYKQLLVVLDVDNPEVLNFTNKALDSYAYQKKNSETEAETHKRIVAERLQNLARYLIVNDNKSDSSEFLDSFINGLSAENEYGIFGLNWLLEEQFNQSDNRPILSTFGYHEGGGFLFVDREVADKYNTVLYNQKIQEADSLLGIKTFESALEVLYQAYDYVGDVYLERREFLDEHIRLVKFKQVFYKGIGALEANNCEQARKYFLAALSIRPNDPEALQKIIECDACTGKKSVGIEE